MASIQVATTLTITYWIATVLFFAIPLTAILCFMVLLDRFAKFNVSREHSRPLER
jgi:hypothetical protein